MSEVLRLRKRGIGESLLYGKSMLPALGLLLLILVLVFGFGTKNFFTLGTFKAIISNMPVIAIMSVGMTFVLLIGGLDLSVGSILGFTAVNVVLFHDVFEKRGVPLGWIPALVVLLQPGPGGAPRHDQRPDHHPGGDQPGHHHPGHDGLRPRAFLLVRAGLRDPEDRPDHGPEVPGHGQGLPAQRQDGDHPHHPDLRGGPVRPGHRRAALHPLRPERVRRGVQRVRRAPGRHRRAADQVRRATSSPAPWPRWPAPSWWPS